MNGRLPSTGVISQPINFFHASYLVTRLVSYGRVAIRRRSEQARRAVAAPSLLTCDAKMFSMHPRTTEVSYGR